MDPHGQARNSPEPPGPRQRPAPATGRLRFLGQGNPGTHRPPEQHPRCRHNAAAYITPRKRRELVWGGEGSSEPAVETNARAAVSALAIAACATAMPEAAHASGGEFGILEGRTSALVHPIGFGAMYGISLYAGWLGLQWRRVRTVGDEITELKKTLPADAEAAAGSAVAKQIDELAATRKELVAGKFKDKHANMGYLLLALGVTLAVEGGMNTYLRVGKLFPGPHLYAGASIVVLWAMAAGLVPQMEKGNQKARDLHIALNCINVALFTWQIPTGLEIVGKVFQFTSWP